MFNGNIKRNATITKIKLSCVFCITLGGSSILQPERHVFFVMIYLFSFFACLVILFFDIYIYIYIYIYGCKKAAFLQEYIFVKKLFSVRKLFYFCKKAAFLGKKPAFLHI